MSKLYFLLICLFLSVYPAFSQEEKSEFGRVTLEELELEAYEKDQEAPAVVLFDKGESYFYDTPKGYDIRFTRTKRVKIFEKAGIPFSEISIPFYVDGFGKTEKVVSVEAFTYNLAEGKITKKALDPNSVFEERVNDRWRVKKFVFPSVQEGSVIEFRYVLETPFHFNLPDWAFQDQIPTIYSEYTVKMIPFYEYAFLGQGISRFHYQKSFLGEEERSYGQVSKSYGQNIGSGFEFKDMVHIYAMKDVPAFKDEEFITSPGDYLMKIDFQLSKFHSPKGGTSEIITSWPELTENLLEHDHFGKYLRKSKRPAGKIIESEMDFTGKSSAEKSRMIIDYVKSNFQWNGSYSMYASKKPKELVNQKTGNAADINLFMLAMMEAAGVKAQPVILSTRDHGKIRVDYPFSHFFNYVIVMIEGEGFAFLADGTERLLGYDRVPPRCINEKGLVVAEGEPLWVELGNSLISVNNKTINLHINPVELSAEAIVTFQATEFESFRFKSSFGDDTVKIREHLMDYGFSKIERIKTIGFEENSRPYIISVKGETAVEKINDKLIVSPFLHFPIKESPLTAESRSYPVDFIYPKTEKFSSSVNIPDGYQVTDLPQNFSMDNGLAEIKISFSKNEKQLLVTSSYTFKKAIYQPEEYSLVKTYMELIAEKLNQQIVFQAMK